MLSLQQAPRELDGGPVILIPEIRKCLRAKLPTGRDRVRSVCFGCLSLSNSTEGLGELMKCRAIYGYVVEFVRPQVDANGRPHVCKRQG